MSMNTKQQLNPTRFHQDNRYRNMSLNILQQLNNYSEADFFHTPFSSSSSSSLTRNVIPTLILGIREYLFGTYANKLCEERDLNLDYAFLTKIHFQSARAPLEPYVYENIKK